MKLVQKEIPDPENYAIFYLDVFAESLAELKPWQNKDPQWADPIKVFKVRIPSCASLWMKAVISRYFIQKTTAKRRVFDLDYVDFVLKQSNCQPYRVS